MNEQPEAEEEAEESSGRKMDAPTVEYREIRDCPGYRVGSDGSVWSCLKRTRFKGMKGTTAIIGTIWRKLKPAPTSEGYPAVRITRKTRTIHRLVLEAFIGPCPEGMESCHFPDTDRSNCRLENLRWDTRSANHRDVSRTPFPLAGKKCPRCKERKPRSEYGFRANRRLGVACWCLACDRIYQTAIRQRKEQERDRRNTIA